MIKKTLLLFIFCFGFYPFSYALKVTKIKTLHTDYCPKAVVISPDGSKAYAINLEGMSIIAYDAITKERLWRAAFIPTPAKGWDYTNKKPINSYAEKPVEAAFTQDGKMLWVSLHNGANVVVIDTEFSTQFKGKTLPMRFYQGKSKQYKTIYVKEIKVGHTPKVISVAPNGKFVYVANWHSHNVSVINPETFEVIKTVPVVRIPRGIDFSPDSRYGFVANMGSNVISVLDTEKNHKLIKNYFVGLTPRHLVASKDGQYLYISLNREGKVVKFDVAMGKVVQAVFVGSNPRTLALTPDEKHIFVVEYKEKRMSVLDSQTFEVLGTYPTGISPVGVAITPNGKEAWVANYSVSTLEVFSIEP